MSADAVANFKLANVAELRAEREQEWPDPLPLPSGRPDVQAFDAALLPISLRGWVTDCAERMDVPIDFIAIPATVALGAVIGRRIGIRPKRKDNWLEAANLAGAVVARPAKLKTPAINQGLSPLRRLAADAREKHNEAAAEHERETLIAEARLKAAKAKMDKSAKEGKDISGMLDGLESMPEPPQARRYTVSDATVPKVADILTHNPQGILVVRDELVGWFRSFEKFANGGDDRQFYLSALTGTVEGYEVDRMGRGSTVVPALCISLIGGIQPGPLCSYVYDAAKGRADDDGLLQRLQLAVWPDSPAEPQYIDRAPDSDARDAAHLVYERLADFTPEQLGAEKREHDSIPTIQFDDAAQERFAQWHQRHKKDLEGGDYSPSFEAHLGKYFGTVAKLALGFHLADVVAERASVGPIADEALVRAIAWSDYLRTHAARMYAAAERPSLVSANALLARLRKSAVRLGDDHGFAARDVYRHDWSRLTTSDEVRAAVEVLVDHRWVRVRTLPTTTRGGAPPSRVIVHPCLRRTP